jgi:hypothetical protein
MIIETDTHVADMKDYTSEGDGKGGSGNGGITLDLGGDMDNTLDFDPWSGYLISEDGEGCGWGDGEGAGNFYGRKDKIEDYP